MLDQNLEGSAHAVRPQQVNGSIKLRGFWLEGVQELLGAKADQETHLIREPRDLKTGLLAHTRQSGEIYMSGHVLHSNSVVRIFRGRLAVIAEERAVLALGPIEVFSCMAVINRQDGPTVHDLRDLFHPVDCAKVDFRPIAVGQADGAFTQVGREFV